VLAETIPEERFEERRNIIAKY